jgi:hypothetical protein
MRGSIVPMVLAGVLALPGCAASLAAGAVGAAIRSGQKPPTVDPHQGRAALEACTARAAQHGEVHIIDVERRSASEVIVWGTVGQDAGRRSFQCNYRDRISGFKLRPIRPGA